MKISRRAGLKALATGAAAVAMPGIIRAEEQEIVIGAPNSLTGGLGENGQRADPVQAGCTVPRLHGFARFHRLAARQYRYGQSC